jgi:hypothetical protein
VVEGNEQKTNLRERDAGATIAMDLVGSGGGGGVHVHDSFRWRSVQDRGRHCKRLMVEHSFDFLKHVSWKFVICGHHDKSQEGMAKTRGDCEMLHT